MHQDPCAYRANSAYLKDWELKLRAVGPFAVPIAVLHRLLTASPFEATPPVVLA